MTILEYADFRLNPICHLLFMFNYHHGIVYVLIEK